MLREYTDKTGVAWRVWDVYPSTRSSPPSAPKIPQSENLVAYPTPHFGNGWLCFESAREKRRLAPIPPDWEVCNCDRLEDLCARAGHISRTGPQDAVD